jgi:BlaR1 peptidase M56
MENFILYFGKASALLAVFFLAYYFLLRKETFFNSNRWFLLAGIVASLTLPLVIFTKIVWVEPVVREFIPTPAYYSPIPQSGTETISIGEPALIGEPTFEINWIYVVAGIYLAGMLFFLGKFLRDFWALRKIFKNQTVETLGNFKLVDTDRIQSPFSFFNYIVYNSNRFRQEELDNILEHEKVHSSQLHSADMIISQLFCIAFWFNPFAWLHKKAIVQNLEFIADSTALKTVSDRIIYQKTLLKVSAPHHCIPITNHFFQSLIKKRIVMLNKNQSKRRNSWKYATVLPLLTIFMLQFQVETVAQEKDSAEKYQETNPYEVKVDKNSTDDYLKLQAEIFKKKHGIDVKFSNVKRNSDKEIVAIKTSYKDKDGNSGNTYQKSDKPIQPFKLTKKEDGIVITGANTTVYGKTKNGESVAITANHIEMPIPPIPPVVPAMPAMPNAPAAPQLPTPPTAPTVGFSEDSKEWKEFEEKMQDFEKEMNSKEGEMAKFEKAMEKFEEEMELAFNKDFEKQMEEFEKKMEIFEVQMEAYTAQLEESLEQNSKK